MKKQILFYLLICFAAQAWAQREANIWYFGQKAGVDFNSGSPVALTNSVLNTSEGCATMCDKNGNLLFYTDGIKIWDRTHTQMPNGFGLTGDPSSAQSGVIVPKPGNNKRYYVFTVAAQGNTGGFCYSEVDMTLNGGLGDVVTATKNTLLFTPSTEKVTAVKHANGLYMWVIGHLYNSNQFNAYLIDCNGVSAPVQTKVGPTEGSPGWGYLTASPNGKKLGVAVHGSGFYLYDFDNATGVVSNPITLGYSNGSYGSAFSPDGNLYYGSRIVGGDIYQWNLQAGSAAAIIASATLVGSAKGGISTPTAYRGGALQLGPNGKIYFPDYMMSSLSEISNPNGLGAACNIQYTTVSLAGRNAVLGLPGLIQSYFDTAVEINHVNHCQGDQTTFTISGTPTILDSVRWYFDDPASGAQNTSNSLTPAHQFTVADTFSVMLIKYVKCITDTTYDSVIIHPIPVVNLGNDTSICTGSVTLQSSATYTNPAYEWNTGATTSSITVTTGGSYTLKVTEDGCVGTDNITISIQGTLTVDLGPDKDICETDIPYTLTSTQPAGAQYTWSTGLTSGSIDIVQSGKYWLYVNIGNCFGSDTINIRVVPPPVVDAGRDTTICEATPVLIGVFIPFATYSWSNDSTTPFVNVAATGDYVLTVTLGPCVVKDTVSITAIPNPAIDLGNDTALCAKDMIELNAGDEGIKYLWNDGSTAKTKVVTDIGTYWVTVTSEYTCVNSDTIKISEAPLPSILLGADTTVCEEVPLMIQPVYSINEDALLWSDGSTGRQISVTQEGLYYVYATNKCGAVGDSININQIFCDIRVPNAFTPNGDGVNDILKTLGNIERLKDFSFNIYNRWGELIFTTIDKRAGWDGKRDGMPCSEGVFVYMLQYSLDGKPVFQKGNVTLIR